jgi:hypothetical protein
LHQESEGNPFIFWELLRQWSEWGILRISPEGGCEISTDRLVDAGLVAAPGKWVAERLPPPEAVRAVVRQRLSRQLEEDRSLLECAAVIGRRFTFEVLQRATGCDPRTVLAGLERLLAAALIDAPPGSDAYDFRHDKIREVLYDELMPLRRRELHRRVGEALEAAYGIAGVNPFEERTHPAWVRRSPSPARARAEERAEELAWHFGAAMPLIGPERAAGYLYLAGTRARALNAYNRAATALSEARSLLEPLPMNPSNLARLGEVVEQLGPAYSGSGRREEARQLLEDHISLCRRCRDTRGLVRGYHCLAQFLELHPTAAASITCQELYEEIIELCEAHGFDDLLAYPQYALAFWLLYGNTDRERAETLVRASLRWAEAQQDAYLLQRLYALRIWLSAFREDWEGVRGAFRSSLAFGGPEWYTFSLALTMIESTCLRNNDEVTLRALTREFAAGYADSGLIAPFQQWNLEPTAALLLTGKPALHEGFDAEPWHAALVWQDPTHNSQVDWTSRPGWLGLKPASGANLWPETNLNAPRLMVPAITENEDRHAYVAQTRVELDSGAEVFGGLLLWRDEQHFVRLEIRPTRWEWEAIRLEACVAGAFGQVGRGHCKRGPIWLRLERTAEQVRGLCSEDGESWLLCGSVPLAPGRTELVGLAALSQGDSGMAWFDAFTWWAGVEGTDG